MPFYDAVLKQDAISSNFRISFTRNPKGDFGVFAKGYTLAANRLTQSLLEAPRFSDYEAYPVVYLYRHALELSLKHVIFSCPVLAAFQSIKVGDYGLQNSHNLTHLSGIVEKLTVKLFPKDVSLRHVIARVTETCREFSDLDAGSYGYRYPINKEGQHSTKSHQVVNLKAFGDRMSSVLADLAVLRFGLDIETDQAQEIFEILQEARDSAASEYGDLDEEGDAAERLPEEDLPF